jgi:hypothetical protein
VSGYYAHSCFRCCPKHFTPCFSSDHDVNYRCSLTKIPWSSYSCHQRASHYSCSDHEGRRFHISDDVHFYQRFRFDGYGTHRRYCRHELKSLEQLGHVALVLNAAAARLIFAPLSVHILHLQPPSQLGLVLSHGSLQLASLQLWFRDNKQRMQLLGCSGALSNLAFRMARGNGKESGFLVFEHSREHGFMSVIVRRCLSIYAWRHHLDDRQTWCDDDDDDDDDGPPTISRNGKWAVL